MTSHAYQAHDPNAAAAAGPLARRYLAVRARSVALARPLSAEDAMVQSMPEASPVKWHLAHTTWFFERFVLAADPGYAPVEPAWDYLFNSYYHSVGAQHARRSRGLLSRPGLAQVLDYRARIDERLGRLLEGGAMDSRLLDIVLLGTHHEEQHQELMLTDIKHAFWSNPLKPAYRPRSEAAGGAPAAPPPPASGSWRWLAQGERLAGIGAPPWPASPDYAFDNESPRHRVLLPAHAVADRLVTNAEFAQFMREGGYRNPALWLSDGWDWVESERLSRPLYWHEDGDREFTLAGWADRAAGAPVCHLSFFEADAFARWAGARLPTEAEWEASAAKLPREGNFLEAGLLRPAPAPPGEDGPRQFFGDAWEWTGSPYTAYPGFVPLDGALGEYNGKFMNAQWVLRGGSCVTPRSHIRASYRNFFPPATRWQFSGLRLAKDLA